MSLLTELIRGHGWHLIAELAALTVVTAFGILYAAALLRGRVRAVPCPACGRIASRANPLCPRCGASLRPGPD